MTEPKWKPLFRNKESTITRVLESPAFIESREQAAVIMDDPAALRVLAHVVEQVDSTNAPLAAVADRLAAAVRFLMDRADSLDIDAAATPSARQRAAMTSPAAGQTARVRLIVAALHYLITPIDLVPDFRAGGYLDDVLLLSWIFGAAVNELDPFLADGQA